MIVYTWVPKNTKARKGGRKQKVSLMFSIETGLPVSRQSSSLQAIRQIVKL